VAAQHGHIVSPRTDLGTTDVLVPLALELFRDAERRRRRGLRHGLRTWWDAFSHPFALLNGFSDWTDEAGQGGEVTIAMRQQETFDMAFPRGERRTQHLR